MSPETILYIIIAAIVSIAIAVFIYGYKSKHTGSFKWLFGVLRALSLFSLLLLIINPKFKSEAFTIVKPSLAVLIDDSQSIETLNATETVEKIISQLQNNSPLKDRFDMSFFKFSDGIEIIDSLSFSKKSTNISKALFETEDLYTEKVAPIVILTDGNQTVGEDYKYSSKRLKSPVYPIVVGDTSRYEDVFVSQLNTNKYSFFKNKFPVEAVLNYTGTVAVNTKCVISKNGKTVYSQPITFSATQQTQVINCTLEADAIGFQKYTIQVLPLTNEKNTRNNTAYFAVEVIDQSTNVLLVSNIVHPDLGALKKAITSNKQRKLEIVKPAQAIPLLNDAQLVILYQPDPSFSGIYSEINKLSKNTLTITGLQTDWTFLNASQTLFTKEVTSQEEEATAQLNTNFTSFFVDYTDVSSTPPLKTLFGALEIKTPHEVLLEQYVDGFSSETPLMATMELNGSRNAIIDGEDIWKWRAESYIKNNNFETFDTFIEKTVQYLASTKRRSRLEINNESFYYNNKPILISAQYFDKNFEFDTRVPLQITVVNQDTKEKTVFPMLLRSNFFEVDLSSLPPAEYNFTVATTDASIARSGSFTIIGYEVEKQFGNASISNLSVLATTTFGAVFLPNEGEMLATTLLNDNRYKPVQKSEIKTVSLIDWKYLLGFIAFLLSIEWFVRKYNGLI